jgi:hypothetical protein
MNIYTIEEVRVLAGIYQGHNDPSALTTEEMEKYGGNFSYVDLMETVINDKKLPGASLMEFIGAYDMAATTPEGWDELKRMLFDAPLSEMPKHINDEGTEEWKKKVAQWRLQLNK